MSTLIQASNQWASRPSDERFLDLISMRDHFHSVRDRSRALVVSSRKLALVPGADHKGLAIVGANGVPYAPTHNAFGQLCSLVGAPAGYLRGMPADIAADCVNWNLRDRKVEDMGLLLYKNGDSMLRAATGPKYGRIWNADILDGMTRVLGDGVTGDWRVPGEFGQAIMVDKKNTTLYAGDRDMFVFLADEKNRITIPNRRDGKDGTLARGFFVWNSEVGASTFGISTFLFDYACKNRTVWGAEDVKELRIRHTASAPERFFEEIQPALESFGNSSTHSITVAIANAQAARIGDKDKVDDFLANRYTKRMSATLQQIHQLEEGRPIETLWDASVAVTARARSIEYQDERVEIEREGGRLIQLAQ